MHRPKIDIRYSFTAHFLIRARYFASRALEFEQEGGASEDIPTVMHHRSYVVSTVMQSVAALETEIFEVTTHGLGHHLGSDGIDLAAYTLNQVNSQRERQMEIDLDTLLLIVILILQIFMLVRRW
jgi:hypothetical protein